MRFTLGFDLAAASAQSIESEIAERGKKGSFKQEVQFLMAQERAESELE